MFLCHLSIPVAMGEQLTIEQYEVLVKRMKILSQSQTAFLKVSIRVCSPLSLSFTNSPEVY